MKRRQSIAGFIVMSVVMQVWFVPSAVLADMYRDDGGGFSFELNEGWRMGTYPDLKYALAIGEEINGYASNINILDEEFQGSLTEYLQKNVTVLQKALPEFQNLGHTDFVFDHLGKGIKLITESVQYDKGIRQIFYFIDGGDGRKIIVACSVAIGPDGNMDAAFDTMLKTFQIGPLLRSTLR